MDARVMRAAIATLAVGLAAAAGTLAYAQGPAPAGQWWNVTANGPNPAVGPDHMNYIPKEFGRLVSVETLRSPGQEGTGKSWLWFEAADGTVRLVRLSIQGVDNGVWQLVTKFPRR